MIMNKKDMNDYSDIRVQHETSAMNLQRLDGETGQTHRPQQQQQQQQQSKLSRVFRRDASNPEEILILNLKLHLDKLQRDRQYKNAQLAARNVLLIERDEEAEAEYRRTHKTDEELYQDWVEETKKQHAAERLAFERDGEVPIRALVQEEEMEERKYVTYQYYLAYNVFNVERIFAENKRKERAEMEKIQKARTLQDAFNRSAKLLFDSWTDGTVVIEREEKASRRNICGRFPSDTADAKKRTDQRLKREHDDKEKARVEAMQQKEKQLDEEVDDMEAEFAARMEKLRNKFK